MEFLVATQQGGTVFAVRFRGAEPRERRILGGGRPGLPVLAEAALGPLKEAFPLPVLFRAVWPEEPDVEALWARGGLPAPADPWERAEALGRLFLRALEETRAWPDPARRALAALLPAGLGLPPRPPPAPRRPPASLDEARRRLQALGLEERREQRAYAQSVWEALTQEKVVLLEAGPGTGKTFGYLIPLLLRLREGGRAVVATRTRTLQDQLWKRDLPWLEERLGLRVRRALLKGRENYPCLWRLRRLRAQLLVPEDLLRALELLALRRADLDEVGFLPETGLMEEIRDKPGRCLGGRCPELGRCPSRLAREEARAAQLVVANHALLGADLARENALLGPYDFLVVDEAHALPTALREALGVNLAPQEVPGLLSELVQRGAPAEAAPLVEEVRRRHREFWSAVQGVIPPGRARLAPQALAHLGAQAEPLGQALAALAQTVQRTEELAELGTALAEEAQALAFFFAPKEGAWVPWSAQDEGPSLHLTPLDLSERLRRDLWPELRAAILTSATLAVPGNPRFVAERLGLPHEVEFHSWPSPFPYARVKIAILAYLPEPDHPEYPAALAQTLRHVLGRAPAKALVLFTARQMLAEVHRLLGDVPHLAQGWDGERDQLLRRFRALRPPAALLGLESFWEGVDLPGAELEILVVARLPFPSPGDPVLEAEAQRLRAQGRSDFQELALPLALLKLRQGLGRLVRTPTDRGVILLGDPRLVSRAYRGRFLRVLPVPPQVVQDPKDLDVVLAQVFG
ncbi:MAG: ATP-dependent DNA helicase [Candidatus Bipolaricaulaceae bacterium]